MTTMPNHNMKAKKKKRTVRVGEKEFDVMARAVAAYIEAMGGTAAFIGGVSVGQNPYALKFRYFIQIDITGKKPVKKNL